MSTVHLLVKGKVQGVFYRGSAKELADTLSITGWVRNTREGDVEILATGSPQALEEFIDWCHRGPRQATVEEVIKEAADPTEHTGFSIIR